MGVLTDIYGGGIALHLLTGRGACCRYTPWGLASSTSLALIFRRARVIWLVAHSGTLSFWRSTAVIGSFAVDVIVQER